MRTARIVLVLVLVVFALLPAYGQTPKQIQRRLEEDVAKPMLGWRTAYFAAWPHVKNLIPHSPIYNFARMQDVWLDR